MSKETGAVINSRTKHSQWKIKDLVKEVRNIAPYLLNLQIPPIVNSGQRMADRVNKSR
jgi:hypothetical protein